MLSPSSFPKYANEEEELAELMQFFHFAYSRASNYKGTVKFEMLLESNKDSNSKNALKQKAIIRTIRADPQNGIEVFEGDPPDGEVTCHVTLPFSTFHDVFWGHIAPRAFVVGGGCQVHNWKYRELLNFGSSFDMSTQNWMKSTTTTKNTSTDYDWKAEKQTQEVGKNQEIEAEKNDREQMPGLKLVRELVMRSGDSLQCNDKNDLLGDSFQLPLNKVNEIDYMPFVPEIVTGGELYDFEILQNNILSVFEPFWRGSVSLLAKYDTKHNQMSLQRTKTTTTSPASSTTTTTTSSTTWNASDTDSGNENEEMTMMTTMTKQKYMLNGHHSSHRYHGNYLQNFVRNFQWKHLMPLTGVNTQMDTNEYTNFHGTRADAISSRINFKRLFVHNFLSNSCLNSSAFGLEDTRLGNNDTLSSRPLTTFTLQMSNENDACMMSPLLIGCNIHQSQSSFSSTRSQINCTEKHLNWVSDWNNFPMAIQLQKRKCGSNVKLLIHLAIGIIVCKLNTLFFWRALCDTKKKKKSITNNKIWM
ncbi:hypothetical protein RFI_03281 [Reticulomyxa filosa]|uniref:Uncharacterized protein n=1 Tax=Reticulomyxa filosa TaxID=46433 RepID=X6P5J0_RETFI|nr:hypothetical protein RFI_03281 [Reticulomyxa filosa]|eukprot:ETO33820.1 hypothetical protein RFI_03281 [Reticulomyxa filosa]